MFISLVLLPASPNAAETHKNEPQGILLPSIFDSLSKRTNVLCEYCLVEFLLYSRESSVENHFTLDWEIEKHLRERERDTQQL